MHLLLTRPEAGAEPDALTAALVAAGHLITQGPLISVSPTGKMPALAGVQALLVTSRNALKAIAPTLDDAARKLPLVAVGPATAALAHELGFERVIEGPGSGVEMLPLIEAELSPAGGTLLHLSGDTIAVDLKPPLEAAGFSVRREVVYQTQAAESLPPSAAEALRAGGLDGVVLMSPRTARTYVKLVAEAGLSSEAARLAHYCLSEAVGRELAPLGAVKVAVARLPNSQEMLALIARHASDSA